MQFDTKKQLEVCLPLPCILFSIKTFFTTFSTIVNLGVKLTASATTHGLWRELTRNFFNDFPQYKIPPMYRLHKRYNAVKDLVEF